MVVYNPLVVSDGQMCGMDPAMHSAALPSELERPASIPMQQCWTDSRHFVVVVSETGW